MALVNKAEPALDAAIKNDALRLVIVVEGVDGYQATFVLGGIVARFWESAGVDCTG